MKSRVNSDPKVAGSLNINEDLSSDKRGFAGLADKVDGSCSTL